MANRLSEKCGNRPAPESALCYLYGRLESHKKTTGLVRGHTGLSPDCTQGENIKHQLLPQMLASGIELFL